jgi:hypothetical protein
MGLRGTARPAVNGTYNFGDEFPALAKELSPCKECGELPRVYWNGVELRAHCNTKYPYFCGEYTKTPLYEDWNKAHDKTFPM